jgi:hypothetical protein
MNKKITEQYRNTQIKIWKFLKKTLCLGLIIFGLSLSASLCTKNCLLTLISIISGGITTVVGIYLVCLEKKLIKKGILIEKFDFPGS